ncbi:MAG TPA: hypothetical protein VEH29_13445, partial [Acidimicrobiales bacterium]|nr:hypothetical protein [Acidimicrobiales bacterium]
PPVLVAAEERGWVTRGLLYKEEVPFIEFEAPAPAAAPSPAGAFAFDWTEPPAAPEPKPEVEPERQPEPVGSSPGHPWPAWSLPVQNEPAAAPPPPPPSQPLEPAARGWWNDDGTEWPGFGSFGASGPARANGPADSAGVVLPAAEEPTQTIAAVPAEQKPPRRQRPPVGERLAAIAARLVGVDQR